jgi:hypothetical protein
MYFRCCGGKAVDTGMGLSLTTVLVTSEKAIGFNLQSYGPISVGLLL